MGRKDREEHWRHQEAMAAKAEEVLLKVNKSGRKDKTWRAAVIAFISENSFCSDCAKRGFVSVAEWIVHANDPKEDRVLFWDRNNWISVCPPCHARITGNRPLKVLEPIKLGIDLYLVEK
ncbi:hypothetical protein F9K57_03130 [Acinetobacter baumannii]|nr:hypothetical protein F9K57_03130 [Acinetobacter baumannii]